MLESAHSAHCFQGKRITVSSHRCPCFQRQKRKSCQKKRLYVNYEANESAAPNPPDVRATKLLPVDVPAKEPLDDASPDKWITVILLRQQDQEFSSRWHDAGSICWQDDRHAGHDFPWNEESKCQPNWSTNPTWWCARVKTHSSDQGPDPKAIVLPVSWSEEVRRKDCFCLLQSPDVDISSDTAVTAGNIRYLPLRLHDSIFLCNPIGVRGCSLHDDVLRRNSNWFGNIKHLWSKILQLSNKMNPRIHLKSFRTWVENEIHENHWNEVDEKVES